MTDLPLPAPARAGAGTPERGGWPRAAGPPTGRLVSTVGAHLAVTDLRSVTLLSFTAVTAGLVGGGLRAPGRLALITLALTLAGMGARATANYIDRDIDAVMQRTSRRAVPSGRVRPGHALAIGLTLLAAGIALTVPFGWLVLTATVAGLADNLVVYSLLTKRTSPWGIVLGAPSGGAPAFVGYLALAGHITTTAVLLAALVVLWTPVHIWSLAIRYRDDYARAGVPMLPVAAGVRRSARCIGAASLALAAGSILFVFLAAPPLLLGTAVAVLASAAVLVAGSIWLMGSPTAGHAWLLFKLTSPHLAFLFAVLALNAFLVS